MCAIFKPGSKVASTGWFARLGSGEIVCIRPFWMLGRSFGLLWVDLVEAEYNAKSSGDLVLGGAEIESGGGK